MVELKLQRPEWDGVPYQVKRTAVRDACRAMSNVKEFNKQLADAKARGERLDQDFSELHFRSRKNPRQSCYIPDDEVRDNGIYYTILDTLRMAEAVPESPKSPGWYGTEANTGWSCLTRRNATLRPHAVMAQLRSTPASAPFSRSSPKPNAAKSDTRPSGGYNASASGWTTSSAEPTLSQTAAAVGACAKLRNECGRESPTWWMNSTGRRPAG